MLCLTQILWVPPSHFSLPIVTPTLVFCGQTTSAVGGHLKFPLPHDKSFFSRLSPFLSSDMREGGIAIAIDKE